MLKSGNEGYVTFISDQAAGFAFLNEEKNGYGIRTEVAYPWHQPEPKAEAAVDGDNEEQMDLDEPFSPPILELNDDCLFMIFDRCDNATLVNLSEICVRFANLLEKHYRFPNIDKTLSVLESGDDTYISSIMLHKMVRLMGRHFEILCFNEHEMFYSSHKESDVKFFHRILQKIAKYCTNINHMIFRVFVFRNELISMLKPIFKNLVKLEIDYSDSCEVNREIDITELLPKLKTFETDCLLDNCLKKSWPSLESFIYSCIEFWEGLEQFFVLNPQLRHLELFEDGINNLKAVADYLPNIDRLNLNWINNTAELIHVARFSNLIELELGDIQYDKLTELCGHLKGLNKLKTLQIYFKPYNPEILTKGHQQAIVSLAKTHRNIERLDLVRLKLDEATVVDFVRFASKLKSLHLHKCGVFATASLITKLVNVRKCNRENPNKLKLFIDNDTQNRNDLEAIKENEAQQHLLVAWNCEHNNYTIYGLDVKW